MSLDESGTDKSESKKQNNFERIKGLWDKATTSRREEDIRTYLKSLEYYLNRLSFLTVFTFDDDSSITAEVLSNKIFELINPTNHETTKPSLTIEVVVGLGFSPERVEMFFKDSISTTHKTAKQVADAVLLGQGRETIQ